MRFLIMTTCILASTAAMAQSVETQQEPAGISAGCYSGSFDYDKTQVIMPNNITYNIEPCGEEKINQSDLDRAQMAEASGGPPAGFFGNAPNTGGDDSEYSYPKGSHGGPTRRPILGVFLFLFGAMLTKFCMDITDEPDKPAWLVIGSFILWSFAAGAVISGTCFVLV